VTRRLINPPELFDGAPYSYVAVASGKGTAFAAGACPLDADGQVVEPGEVVEERFGAKGPPSTLLGVTVLGYSGQLVEIEAVATRS
jgi:enamine deaminase RidA (YjgF/YER057c/UK114 family)